MNNFEKNMEYLKKYKINLYTKLEKLDLAPINNKLDSIESVVTKDGDKAVLINFNSMAYRLNSIYRPNEESQRWVEQYKFTNINTVVTMFGFGNGLFARKLVERMGDKDLLLIYEPCYEIFIHVLNNYDISDLFLHKRIFLFIEGINDIEFRQGLNQVLDITNLKTQLQCIYPNYDIIFKESYHKYIIQLKEGITSVRINLNTTIYFGQKYIDNNLKNIQYLKGSSSLFDLKEVLTDEVPAIIVAAGPSVKDNIDELKRAKGHAVIFAVDRVLDYLLDSGIEPDFVVTIDPKKDLKYFTTRTDVTIPLICYMESNFDILNIHKGRKIICTNGSFADNIYIHQNKRPPFLTPSGSVAIVAYSACIELGFKRIILVGQDLAYHGEQTHVGNTNEETASISNGTMNIMTEGIDGNPVKSRYDWKEFIIRYQDLIGLYNNVEVIDAKEKGAKIKGTIVMPLKEAVDTYCKGEFDRDLALKNLKTSFTSDEIQEIKEYLIRNLEIVKNIKEKANKAKDDCNTLLKLNNSSVMSKKEKDIINRLGKSNKYIESQKIYALMDSFITAKSAQQLSDIYYFTDDMLENNKNTYEKSRIIYQSIVEAADYIYPRLEAAIDYIS
jgi:hypothetical protein